MRKTPNFAVALVALGAFTQLATRPALAAENCYGSYTSCRALTGPDVDGTCRAIYNACVKRNAGKASGQASGSRLVSGAHITVDGSLVTPAGKPSTWNGKATNSVVVNGAALGGSAGAAATGTGSTVHGNSATISSAGNILQGAKATIGGAAMSGSRNGGRTNMRTQ
ncbi:MAG TPA: hypothetical protein VFI98_01640 [Pseudolabrys sp.]|jgi:hypothetical protein|nr:hypothetical protein [Pseudolabrys sp.]